MNLSVSAEPSSTWKGRVLTAVCRVNGWVVGSRAGGRGGVGTGRGARLWQGSGWALLEEFGSWGCRSLSFPLGANSRSLGIIGVPGPRHRLDGKR